MKKLEPYYDSIFHILFFIVVFIIFGIFMYAAIVLTEKHPWLQAQFATLWLLGFLITLFFIFQEICEIGRIGKLQKRFQGKD